MSLADPLAPADPLEAAPPPERVNYSIGVLLDAQDFRDEQTYHRGRLAAALKALVGFGTLAGLRVVPPVAADAELELSVQPGLAIDRFGRLIEIRAPQCIRLARWFAAQSTASLRAAVQRTPRVTAPVTAGVVVDVFLSADNCPRGKTPAFATGPFDALDAVVPARLAESHHLTLTPRAEGPPDPIPTPKNFWLDVAANRDAQLQAVLGGWEPAGDDNTLDPLAEHVEGQDPSAILLARVTIPVDLAPAAPSGTRPTLKLTQRVSVDNGPRPFIFLPGKWLGRAATSAPLVQP